MKNTKPAITATPVYDEAYQAAIDHTIEVDDMEGLTILENMNAETAIQPLLHTNHRCDPVPF